MCDIRNLSKMAIRCSHPVANRNVGDTLPDRAIHHRLAPDTTKILVIPTLLITRQLYTLDLMGGNYAIGRCKGLPLRKVVQVFGYNEQVGYSTLFYTCRLVYQYVIFSIIVISFYYHLCHLLWTCSLIYVFD